MRLTMAHVERIRELRYMDGLSLAATARVVGCSSATVQKRAPGRPGKVPVAPLRKAFLASRMTAADVARGMGWFQGRDSLADTGRVRRTLGLIDDVSSTGNRSRRINVDAETVMLMAEIIGVSPWSVLPDEEVAA